MTRPILTRRSMVIGGATVLATPYLWSRSARAAGQVVVRNPGGAYDETQRRNVYDPFTKETGIEVVVVASTMAKMLAMVKAGSTELDVADVRIRPQFHRGSKPPKKAAAVCAGTLPSILH